MAPMLGVDWVPSGGLVRIGQSLGVARRKRHEVLCRHESRAAARRSSQSSELGTSVLGTFAAVVRFNLVRISSRRCVTTAFSHLVFLLVLSHLVIAAREGLRSYHISVG